MRLATKPTKPSQEEGGGEGKELQLQTAVIFAQAPIRMIRRQPLTTASIIFARGNPPGLPRDLLCCKCLMLLGTVHGADDVRQEEIAER
jgi:hypothetical protein